MRYAAALANAGPCGDPRTLAKLAQLAEQAGWDGVLLEDYIVHHMAPGQLPVYDPWVGLAAIAMRTSRIRLGTLVTALPRRRPWKVAREALTIDHLSGGRMILGVGLGDGNKDWSFSKFGEPAEYGTRAEMTDEALEILAGLWTGEPFSYHGVHFKIGELTFLPAPVQKPRIPIWIGGIWPRKGRRGFGRAFRFEGFAGYRGVPGSPDHGPLTSRDVAEIKEIAAQQKQGASFDIVVGGWPRGADPARERDLRNACAAAGATWWQEYVIGGPEQISEIIRSGPLRAD